MTMNSSVAEIKRGYLTRLQGGIRLAPMTRKKWVKLVECGQTRDLRLQVYLSEKSARDGDVPKECVKLDDAKLAIRTSKHKYTFVIELNAENNERKTLMFSSDSDTDADDWVDAINRMLMQSNSSQQWHESSAATFTHATDFNKLTSLGDGRFYVTPTVYHDRLHCRPGDTCVLKTTPEKIILMNETGYDVLVEWSLAALRRYGNTAEYFQFEAGRRTTTGEGVYTMMTKDGQEIYDLVHRYTQDLVERSRGAHTPGTTSSAIPRSASLNSSTAASQSSRNSRSASVRSGNGSVATPDGSLPANSGGGRGAVMRGGLSSSFSMPSPGADQSTYQALTPGSLSPSTTYESTQSSQRTSHPATGVQQDTYQGLSALTADQPPTYMDVVASDRQAKRQGTGAAPAAPATAAALPAGDAGSGLYQPLQPVTRVPAPSSNSTDTYQPVSAPAQENTYQGVSAVSRQAALQQQQQQGTYQALQ